MKTPDPNNLYLGAGEVFFDRFDANGHSTGLRHLGNVEEFTHTATVNTVQKQSSMSGLRGVLAEATTGVTSEIGMTLSEFESNNLALALLGSEAPFTQAAEVTITARQITATLALDVWYALKDANGNEIINPTVTDVKQGGTTLNAAAYELRGEAGMIRFLSAYTGTGAATAGTAVVWDGSTPALVEADGKRIVQALATSKLLGRVRYISAPDQVNGPRLMVDAWIVNVKPDGDLALIGADFATFKLKGAVQIDASKPTGEQYIRVMYI